jgi:hypothetical protein
MSLYRAGLELASFLPLGIAVAINIAVGFTDVSPVFTLPLQVKATYFLIEPASASTPPSALHAYPVLNLITGYPTGRENLERVRISFNESTPDVLHRDHV